MWFFNTGSDAAPTNFAGRIGAFIAELSYQLLGYAAYLIPLVVAVVGWHYFWCRGSTQPTPSCGAVMLFGCVASFLSLAFGTLEISGKSFRAGGYVGDTLASMLSTYLNRTGSIILILTLLFLSIILSTQFSFSRLFAVRRGCRRRSAGRPGGVAGAAGREAPRQAAAGSREEAPRQGSRRRTVRGRSKEVRGTRGVAGARGQPEAAAPTPKPDDASRRAPPPSSAPRLLRSRPRRPSRRRPGDQTVARARRQRPRCRCPSPRSCRPKRSGAFALPPLALLDPPQDEQKIDERELMEGARLLEDKCREFSVEGTVEEIHPGPVVTTYEFKPDAGVKYSKIVGLADDLALALEAESIRIDRISGKSHRRHRDPERGRARQIYLREILEADAFRKSPRS